MENDVDNYSSNKKEYDKKRYQSKRKELIDYGKRYYREHKVEMRAYRARRRSENINTKLAENLRGRLYAALKNSQKTGSAVRDLGCSIPRLKQHLENQFQKRMTWKNWGRGNGKWNIDHIVSLRKFNLADRKQFLRAANYKNLQPLWFEENLQKR